MKSKWVFFTLLLYSFTAQSLTFEQYQKRPKLVLILVIDQFRSDFLRKFQKSFLPEKIKNEVGGFNYLMKNGAYYPNAEYNILQSMTCPGHAIIVTGSQPHDNGIVLNEWFDKKSNKLIYCASDDEYKFSPRRLKSTTIGDELKSVDKFSRVFSLALKDRSAIMLGGYRANLAMWVDNDDLKWTTSTFYAKDIPEWAKIENEKFVSEYKFSKSNIKDFKKDLASYLGVKITADMAIRAIMSEKLGLGDSTDIMAVSFSTHDMSGHATGPDSLEMKVITHIEDHAIAQILNTIKKSLGNLDDVLVVLTSDHGIAPNVETSKSYKIDSGKFDYDIIYKQVNAELNKTFGKTSTSWIQGHRYLNFYLNNTVLLEKKLAKADVEQVLKTILKKMPGVSDVVTSSEITKGIYPQGELGEQVKRQYLEGISGDVILLPLPFYMEKDDNCVTHMTGYSYDRSVPLIISGRNIKPGVYAGANLIDLAPTLAHILGTLPPTTSSGKVLGQIFK